MSGRLIEGKYTEDHLYGTIQAIVERKTASSKLLDTTAEDLIPKFEDSGKSLMVSRCLGLPCSS